MKISTEPTLQASPPSSDEIYDIAVYKKEIVKRIKRAELVRQSRKHWDLELEMCAASAQHFINSWCFTFDPRYRPNHFPFLLWDYQADFLDWLTERFTRGENGLVEKSRDMGVTWLWIVWCVWKWLFDKGFVTLWGSRKAELVDDGTLDSLFGKARYLLSRLPPFMRPVMNDREDKHMVLRNPWNGNEIVGESANLNFGRQGRYRSTFITEFAFVEHSESVWAGLSETSNCNIVESTPNGKGNQFAWLRHETDIPVKTLHWRLHPRKDENWYRKKASNMQSWQVAQELDISYERSKFGRIYKRFDRNFHISAEPIPCKPEADQFVAWDFGRAGAMALLWGQILPGEFTEIWNCLELSGHDVDFFLPIVLGRKPTHYPLLDYADKARVDKALQKIPKGYDDLYITHYGDHAGTAKTANSTRSCKDAIREVFSEEQGTGEFISTGRQGYDWRFDCFDELLKLKWNPMNGKFEPKFMVSSDCKRYQDCLFNATWDSENIHSDTIKPKTDEFFHMVSAGEFFAINRFPLKETSRTRVEKFR